jgi:hypothetical protein
LVNLVSKRTATPPNSHDIAFLSQKLYISQQNDDKNQQRMSSPQSFTTAPERIPSPFRYPNSPKYEPKSPSPSSEELLIRPTSIPIHSPRTRLASRTPFPARFNMPDELSTHPGSSASSPRQLALTIEEIERYVGNRHVTPSSALIDALLYFSHSVSL